MMMQFKSCTSEGLPFSMPKVVRRAMRGAACIYEGSKMQPFGLLRLLSACCKVIPKVSSHRHCVFTREHSESMSREHRPNNSRGHCHKNTRTIPWQHGHQTQRKRDKQHACQLARKLGQICRAASEVTFSHPSRKADLLFSLLPRRERETLPTPSQQGESKTRPSPRPPDAAPAPATGLRAIPVGPVSAPCSRRCCRKYRSKQLSRLTRRCGGGGPSRNVPGELQIHSGTSGSTLIHLQRYNTIRQGYIQLTEDKQAVTRSSFNKPLSDLFLKR